MTPSRRVAELFGKGETLFSFEFFPPKTARGWERLFHTIGDELIPLEPNYVSVTYGAGGSTRSRTHRLVRRIHEEFNLTVVAHLTCVESDREEIDTILAEYDRIGVHNILALRGDTPKETTAHGASLDRPDRAGGSGFPYAADLVAHIRRRYPHFSIGVAGFPEGHPATPNRVVEIEHLKAKVDAGADFIVTQLFFDNRDYFDFVDRLSLAGVDIPVIAGIMPVGTRKGIARMAELAAGARFPAALLRAIRRTSDDEGIARVGSHWATAQVAELLNAEVPGVHLYTLNNSKATIRICQNLGLASYGGPSRRDTE